MTSAPQPGVGEGSTAGRELGDGVRRGAHGGVQPRVGTAGTSAGRAWSQVGPRALCPGWEGKVSPCLCLLVSWPHRLEGQPCLDKPIDKKPEQVPQQLSTAVTEAPLSRVPWGFQ